MSDQQTPSSTVPRINLEQLKKRAKDLQKLHKQANPAAAPRLQRYLPRLASAPSDEIFARPLRLAEAQFVVAQEAGFSSWPRLVSDLEVRQISEADAEAAFITFALQDDRRGMARYGDAFALHTSRYSACVMAAEHDVAAWGPDFATRAGGPLSCTPLVYLCCSAFGRTDPDVREARRAMAAQLLELGADPSAGMQEPNVLRGYRTALGGAIGCAQDPELAKLLLEAGADVTDGPTLWEGCAMWEALQLADATSLKLLLEAGSPHYQKCHALAYSLHAERPALTALLLEYEADPNWNKTAWCFGGTAMHEALMLGRSIECIEMLTAAGANVESTDRDGRTPLAVATRTGNQEACALLQRAGANAESVTDVDRWIAACLREDGNAAAQLRAKVDTAAHRLRHSDHQWVPRAIRRGTPGAVKYLLEGGASPNVPDDDGQYALHLAAEMADHAVCEVLLRAGANVDARNFDGDTALALACEVDDELSPKKTIDALRSAGADINTMSGAWSAKTPTAADCNEKFERAADAIAAGDADTLRALLEEEPALTMARSSRRHRATLLHYIGANGVEQHRQHTPTNAVEIATLLLEAGSDPNALCLTYRGGPDATTLGLLTSSSHPREAGLTLDLVRVLGNYGAELGPVYRLLITLTAPSHDVPIDSAIDASTLAEGLLEAVRLGNADLVTALLERNANVNAAPRDGVTALHEAALSGNEELLDLLLENGADRELRDQLFNSPAAGWAQAGGHIALAKKLGAAGH